MSYEEYLSANVDEVIEILECWKEPLEEDMKELYKKRYGCDDAWLKVREEATNAAIDVAVDAVKKQIKRKPVPNRNKRKGKPNFECPSCGEPLRGEWRHQCCSECGQAIDWSDSND